MNSYSVLKIEKIFIKLSKQLSDMNLPDIMESSSVKIMFASKVNNDIYMNTV